MDLRQPASWLVRAMSAAGIAALVLAPARLSSQGTTQGAVQSGGPPQDPASPLRFFVALNNRTPPKLADVTMPVPPDNPVTDAKVALGRRLFFDTILSNDRSVSCATCHIPERAFTDERTLAVGVFGRVGRRHSPSLINRGFGRSQFWDGRTTTLELQVVQPIKDPNEMDLSIDDAVARLAAEESYRTTFQAVFERPVSADDLGRALATYLRSLRSGDAPYDRFMAGDTTALTAEQQTGLQIFRTRGACTVCHAEPLFTDEAFRNTGIAWRIDTNTGTGALQDEGRFLVSGMARDHGAFKVPTLREIANTPPYMHDGSLATLAEVIDFYDGGGRQNPSLIPLIRPLRLSADDKRALIAFLGALGGVVTK